MKTLQSLTFFVLSGICCMQASAQYKYGVTYREPDHDRPKLFTDLPEKMNIDVQSLDALLLLPLGAEVSAPLTAKFRLSGNVISKAADNEKVKSVVIQSSNRQGATFTISRVQNSDGSLSYIGRMISFKHGDAYELKKENGAYTLIKKNFYDLVNE